MFNLWIPLLVQAIFAVLGIELFRCRVLRGVGTGECAVSDVAGVREVVGVALDVWGPIALILPLMFQVGWVDDHVAGAGWPALGGPVACGLLALAAGLMLRVERGEATRPKALAIAGWTGAGLILLLQSAAGEMTIWTGQCAFAIAAVLLWMNTPAPGPEPAATDHAAFRIGWALILAVVCAAGQGWASLNVDVRIQPWSAGVTLAYAAVILALAARLAGSGASIRLGGWAATYGVLFALGILSLRVLLPEAYRIAVHRWLISEHGWPRQPAMGAAYGFGTFAVEGTLLLVLGGTAVLATFCPRWGRFALGLAALLGAATMIVLRLRHLA